jgi:hypothetical protein
MRRAAGQVARRAHRFAHVALAIAMVALIAVVAAGWRLAQGPIEVTFLARALKDSLNELNSGWRVDVGRVTVAWNGMSQEGMTPLELRVSAVRLLGRDGALRAELPEAGVSLSLAWLLRGELAPKRLDLRSPIVRLRRDEEGRLSMQLGVPGAAPEAVTAEGAEPLRELLQDMLHPPSEDSPLGALESLRISDARVVVEDAPLGTVWSLDAASLALHRRAQGGIAGRLGAMLRIGDARIPVSGTAEATGEPADVVFSVALPSLQPAQLAATFPQLAPVAAMDAPLRAEVSGRLRLDGSPWSLTLRAEAGAGRVAVPNAGTLAVAHADMTAEIAAEGVTLHAARLRLAGDGAPTIGLGGTMTRGDGGWSVRVAVTLDQAPAGRLREWWPEAALPGARAWVTENVTAGVARNGRWEIAADVDPAFSTPRLLSAAGTLDIEDATVHWLRPIPPAESAFGSMSFALDGITLRIARARQSGGAIELRDGSVRLTFPPGAPEHAEIVVPIAGPVPDALALLQHPRLRLFERRALPVQDPRGVLEGRLSVSLPLLNDLPLEQLQIAAQGRLRDLRLANVALGRNLERGQFEFSVDTAGMRANGTGALGDIQARIGTEFDFRAGPASQVLMRVTAQGRATGAQLASLGIGHEEIVRGPVGLDVRLEQRRTGPIRVTARGDLREATLSIEPAGWTKQPGQNANAEAVLRVVGDALEAVESFRVEAPALLLRGNIAFGRGTRLERVVIDEGHLLANRFAGEARPPSRADGPWQVSLRGRVLSLERHLADERPSGRAGRDASGPALAVHANFERVLLGPQRELAGVEARVQMDARAVIRQGRLTGRAGAGGGFEAAVEPHGSGRSLRMTAQNAGALLAAFDVLRHLEGGRLTVNATFANNEPGAPLSGTAEMDEFIVHNAPAFGKLLQAMTLFGLFEALSGPGLNFARLEAPFTLTPDALTLEDARAFSASLGLTARGTLDRRRNQLAMDGTIVPAYIINSLLGNIPLLGRIFSPERGGGLFAATFRLSGPINDPNVSVNPLAALTPGFLRGIFGLGQN